jgi:RNA polymerase sigma-70 factor (ECF subfamily)
MAFPLFEQRLAASFRGDGRDDTPGWANAARTSVRRADGAAVLSDAELVTRLQAGDSTVLELLLRMHAQRLSEFAYQVVRSDDAAQDIVQETFVKLWDGRATLRLDVALVSYLYRTVRNRALNYVRDEATRRRIGAALLPDAFTQNAGDAKLAATDLVAVIRAALASLQPRCREIFVAYRLSGMSYAELAETFGISMVTARVQVSQAARRITEYVARARA